MSASPVKGPSPGSRSPAKRSPLGGLEAAKSARVTIALTACLPLLMAGLLLGLAIGRWSNTPTVGGTLLVAAGAWVAPRAPPPPEPYLLRSWERRVLPDEALDRGVTYWGSGSALTQFASKLMRGERMHFVVAGGSVSVGRGASSPDASYANTFVHWLMRSFPGEGHTWGNAALAGSTSGVFAACTEQLIPANTSLVVLEFAVNDIPGTGLHSPQRAAYETLLRKLLRRPDPPAVLLLHHYCWDPSRRPGVDRPGAYDVPDTDRDLALLGQYYDLPQVSLKAALWRSMASGDPAFKVDCFRPDCLFVDPCHPSDIGHQALADMLIHSVQLAAKRAERLPPAAAVWSARRRERRQRRELDGSTRDAAAAAAAAALASEHTHRRLAELPQAEADGTPPQHWQARWAPGFMPPPLLDGVADDASPSECWLQRDFHQAVSASSPGFNWRPDRPEAATWAAQKWGWVGTQPGEWVEMTLDSRPDKSREVGGDCLNTTTVFIGHLYSYENMGVAEAECKSGCRCPITRMDGHWDRRMSLMQTHQFDVTWHPQCVIRVTVREREDFSRNITGEGPAGRVVLRSLVVSPTPMILTEDYLRR